MAPQAEVALFSLCLESYFNRDVKQMNEMKSVPDGIKTRSVILKENISNLEICSKIIKLKKGIKKFKKSLRCGTN